MTLVISFFAFHIYFYIFYYSVLASLVANKINFYDTKNVATNILDVVLLSRFYFVCGCCCFPTES